jgi:hypothetical protein
MQSASGLLASCNMRTLYLRNVPDDVIERLERLAALDSMSVSAVAVRELAEASKRVDNAALLGALPDLGGDSATIVADIEAGRGGS